MCYQPVFMILNVIFKQLMCNDDIFTHKFTKVFYIISGEFSIMCDHFQAKVNGGYAGLALAIFAKIIVIKAPMKGAKHILNLPVQSLQVWWITKFVKKYGITFNFRNLQSCLVGINKYLQ